VLAVSLYLALPLHGCHTPLLHHGIQDIGDEGGRLLYSLSKHTRGEWNAR
jgi:hypothetical protein